MKKIIVVFSVVVLSTSLFAQTKESFKPIGKMHFKVYWNYHTDFSSNKIQKNAFEIKRSYFGYKYAFSKDITSKITFDVGKDTGGSAYTAYLKIAQLDWKVSSGVKLSFGMIGLKQFNDQENFWGYRYLFKSFQDQNGFGSSADAGINTAFTLSKKLKANFLIVNGEGYKKLQDINGNQKVGASILYYPINGLTTKIYFDTQSTTGGKAVTSLALFTGYKAKGWRLGAEYNKLRNATKYTKPSNDKNLDGISLYATITLKDNVEVFGRFDQLKSNTLNGDIQNWNFDKDGSQIIFGFQIAPVKGLKLALNYQGFTFDNSVLNTKSLVFLNAEFKL